MPSTLTLTNIFSGYGDFSQALLQHTTRFLPPQATANLAMTCKQLHQATHMRSPVYGASGLKSSAFRHACESAYLRQISCLVDEKLSAWKSQILTSHQQHSGGLTNTTETVNQTYLVLRHRVKKTIHANSANQWFDHQLTYLKKNPFIAPNHSAATYSDEMNHIGNHLLTHWEKLQRQSLLTLARLSFSPIREENIEKLIEDQKAIHFLAFEICFREAFPQTSNQEQEQRVMSELTSRKNALEQTHLIRWANDHF